jgi:hypothetical protein
MRIKILNKKIEILINEFKIYLFLALLTEWKISILITETKPVDAFIFSFKTKTCSFIIGQDHLDIIPENEINMLIIDAVFSLSVQRNLEKHVDEDHDTDPELHAIARQTKREALKNANSNKIVNCIEIDLSDVEGKQFYIDRDMLIKSMTKQDIQDEIYGLLVRGFSPIGAISYLKKVHKLKSLKEAKFLFNIHKTLNKNDKQQVPIKSNLAGQ